MEQREEPFSPPVDAGRPARLYFSSLFTCNIYVIKVFELLGPLRHELVERDNHFHDAMLQRDKWEEFKLFHNHSLWPEVIYYHLVQCALPVGGGCCPTQEKQASDT